MAWMLLNIPLALVMLALAGGVPLWVILRHPEEDQVVDVPRDVLHARPAVQEPEAQPGVRILEPSRG